MSGAPALRAEQLSKRFGRTVALRDLDLTGGQTLNLPARLRGGADASPASLGVAAAVIGATGFRARDISGA